MANDPEAKTGEAPWGETPWGIPSTNTVIFPEKYLREFLNDISTSQTPNEE